MSGHSKWSTIKHQKASQDAKRGQIFTKLANQITIAVRDGGGIGDPNSNFHLRLVIEKAKEVNMPKSNIERAIERGMGKDNGIDILTEVIYDAFGPGGSAILIMCMTENKQRTASSLKNILSQHGGHLSGVGSVDYLFRKLGKLIIPKSMTEDAMLELVVASGAEDMNVSDDNFIIYTQPKNLHQVKIFLENKKLLVNSAEIIYQPLVFADLSDQIKPKLQNLITTLNELDDVQNVYTNIKI